jgi:hypothetical protein
MNLTCFEILEGRRHLEGLGRDGNFCINIELNPLGLGFSVH